MRTRKDIEELESKVLAPYAMKSQDAGARQHDEPQHGWRTCYQRDRDRIVHSEAFRKLEYKTQVFVIFEGDYYRTRLTHTIEVAQLARTLGRNLRLNEDLIEAIALAHDLGHPPFGHTGEEALDQAIKELRSSSGPNTLTPQDLKTCPDGFKPDEQSLRVVDVLEDLNLTQETRLGISGH